MINNLQGTLPALFLGLNKYGYAIKTNCAYRQIIIAQ